MTTSNGALPVEFPEASYLRDLAQRFESPEDANTLRGIASRLDMLERARKPDPLEAAGFDPQGAFDVVFGREGYVEGLAELHRVGIVRALARHLVAARKSISDVRAELADTDVLWRREADYAIALQAELTNIALAKRHDRKCFSDDTEFADWAQSRARHTLAKSPQASLKTASLAELEAATDIPRTLEKPDPCPVSGEKCRAFECLRIGGCRRQVSSSLPVQEAP